MNSFSSIASGGLFRRLGPDREHAAALVRAVTPTPNTGLSPLNDAEEYTAALWTVQTSIVSLFFNLGMLVMRLLSLRWTSSLRRRSLFLFLCVEDEELFIIVISVVRVCVSVCVRVSV